MLSFVKLKRRQRISLQTTQTTTMTIQSAIKRAKNAIRNSILQPGSVILMRKAVEETEKADSEVRRNGRANWRKEVFIVPHYNWNAGTASWYCETKEDQWGVDRMPSWAFNNKKEPNEGESICGITYTAAPKSVGR